MPFASFGSSPLTAFLEGERAPDALWFFVHIPKTAGTSVTAELDRIRSPYANVAIDYERRDIAHDNAIRQAVEAFAAGPIGRTRSASGHVPSDLLGTITQARSDTRLFTLLRDPVRRVISDYTYQTTPAHPLHEAFRKRYPRIEDYVLAPTEQNKMFFFLSGERGAQAFPAAYKAIEQRYAFIGLVELYPMSFNIISRLMGTGALPTEHRRVTSAEAKESVALTPSLVTLIRQANGLDQQLYDRVAGALVPRLAEWQSLQARDAG